MRFCNGPQCLNPAHPRFWFCEECEDRLPPVLLQELDDANPLMKRVSKIPYSQWGAVVEACEHWLREGSEATR